MNKPFSCFSFRFFRFLIVLAWLVFLASPAQAVQQVALAIADKAQLERLAATGLDVEWSQPDAKAFVILYTPADSAALAMTGLAY